MSWAAFGGHDWCASTVRCRPLVLEGLRQACNTTRENIPVCGYLFPIYKYRLTEYRHINNISCNSRNLCLCVCFCFCGSIISRTGHGSLMAKRLGNRAMNQKVAGLIPGRGKMTMCPWARHFTLLASGNVPVLTVSRFE